MNPEKEHSKVHKFVMKHMVTILLSGAVIAWTFVKDLINTGAEVKTKQLIVNVVVENRDIDDHFRVIIKQEIVKTMNDASTWLTVLENDMLAGYTDNQIKEVTEEFDRKIAEIDSAQHNLINDIGKMAGIRNDEFVKIFSLMIREYKSNHLNMVHVDPM